MSKEMAHHILNLWRSGARDYQPAIITQALVVLGDITQTLGQARSYSTNQEND